MKTLLGKAMIRTKISDGARETPLSPVNDGVLAPLQLTNANV
jgi:hypothetical protein